MIRKHIIGCFLLATLILGAGTSANSACIKTVPRMAENGLTNTFYFTVNGKSSSASVDYFAYGGIYYAPTVTIPGVGTYTLTNVSHSPATPSSPNIDKWHVQITVPDGDYYIDVIIDGRENQYWRIFDVTADFIVA